MARGLLLVLLTLSVGARAGKEGEKSGLRGGDFAAEAKAAADKAWELAKKVKKSTEESIKLAEEVEAAGKDAKTAMEKAKKQDEEMTKLYKETKESTFEAAKSAAMDFYKKVKEAGASAAEVAATKHPENAQKVQADIAKAAVEAAMPYFSARLMGQKRAVDYQRRAQAMNAVGNNLEVEGARLAPHADAYQKYLGDTNKASQIIMTAHTLVDEGVKLKGQAKSLHKVAQELTDSLPAYARAEQAAVLHAAAEATPAVLPTNAPPY